MVVALVFPSDVAVDSDADRIMHRSTEALNSNEKHARSLMHRRAHCSMVSEYVSARKYALSRISAGCVNWVVAGRSAHVVGKADGFDVGIAVGTTVGAELVGSIDGMAVGLELAGDAVGATPTTMPSMMCCVSRDCHALVFAGRMYAVSL
jgi:hypothetical protein